MNSATWKATTNSLIDEMAKTHEITPSELVLLFKFVGLGERKLQARESEKIAAPAGGLKVVAG